jgi:hypothetical protein
MAVVWPVTTTGLALDARTRARAHARTRAGRLTQPLPGLRVKPSALHSDFHTV